MPHKAVYKLFIFTGAKAEAAAAKGFTVIMTYIKTATEECRYH